LRVTNNGASAHLAGDGVAYVRVRGGDPRRPARALDVREGWMSVASSDLEPFVVAAARIEGRVYRPVNDASAGLDGEEGPLLERFAGVLLDVRDRNGDPASGVELVRSEEPGIELGAFHPGRTRAKNRRQSERGSPLLVGVGELETPERSLFLRDATSAWRHVATGAQTGDAIDVQLSAGGTLDVRFPAPELLEGMELRVERDGERSMVWRPITEVSTILNGLPPGPVRLVLGPHNARVDQALRVVSSEVHADAVVVVDMFAPDALPTEPATLTGTLDLGDLTLDEIEALGRELHVLIVHDARYAASNAEAGMGKLQGIDLNRMTPADASGRRWNWVSKKVPAGGLRVIVDPFGEQQSVWVEPGATGHVDQVLPPLGRASVSFHEGADGPQVEARVVRVDRLTESFGAVRVTPVKWKARTDGAQGLELLAAPGTIAVSVDDPKFGRFTHEFELQPGPSEPHINVSEAIWLTLQSVGPDGPIAPGDDWWEGVEFVRGAAPVQVLTRSYPFALGVAPSSDGFTSMRVCVSGREPLTIVLPPHPSLGAFSSVRVPDLEGDEGGERTVTLSFNAPR